MMPDEAKTSGAQTPSPSASVTPLPAAAAAVPASVDDLPPPARGGGRWLTAVALVLTALWLGWCGWYVTETIGWVRVPTLAPEVFGGLASGALVPVALLWMVVAVLDRGRAMRREAELLREHLARLTYPDGAAKERVTAVTAALRQQVDLLNAASRQAVERAETARAVLAEEARELGRITGRVDSEAGGAAEALKGQITALEALVTRAEAVGKALAGQVEDQAAKLDGTLGKVEDGGNRLAEVIAGQRKAMDELSEQTTARVSALESLAEREEQAVERAERAGAALREASDALTRSTGETVATLTESAGRMETSAARVGELAQQAKGDVAAVADALDGVAKQALDRTDLALKALGQARDGMTGAAESAVERLGGVEEKTRAYSDSIGGMARDLTAHLEKAGATALERVRALGIATDNIGARAKEAAEDVRAQTDMLEQTAVRVQRQTGSLRGGLEKQVQDVDAVIARLSEQIEGGQKALQGQVETLQAAAGDALERLAKLTEGVQGSARESDAAMARAAEAAAAFEQRLGALMTAAGDTQARLTAIADGLAAAREQVETAAAGADERLSGLSGVFIERARKIVAALDKALDEVVGNAEQRADTLSDAFARKAEEAKAAVDGAVGAAEARLIAAGDAIRGQADTLSTLVEQSSQQAEQRFSVLSAHVAKRATGLLVPVDEAARAVEARLSGVGDGLEAKAAELAQVVDQSAGTAEQRVAALIAALEGQSAALGAPVEAAAAGIERRMEALGMDLGKRTRFLAEQVDKVAGDAEERLLTAATSLGGSVSSLAQAAEHAADALAATDNGVRERAEVLAQITDAALAHIGDLAGSIDQTARRLHDVVVNGSTAVGETAEALDNTIATYRDQTKAIADEMRLASEDFRVRFRDLGRTSDEAMEKVTAALEFMRTQADSLAAAGDRLSDQTSRAGSAFETKADTLARMADRAEEKLRLLEAQRDAADLQRFLNGAVFIIERLQSIAVDITRLFSPTVDEDLWQRYYRGDTSAFLRHAARALTRRQAGQIRELYEANGDFRDYVNRYLSEYETLLRASRQTDRAEVLAATLTSADMGKLYLVLARAVGRQLEG
ncbi:hypothetical protein SAMN05421508_106319 [Caenispirillum bisanense]|uniref:Apolipoprotein A1/A4/E domain-containing protein n=1 Tax=Caenispirillum bisanense TaxID=414052 RepID=A0A286GNS4_9PROT|nr:hypothetical protein SAMN05421508_106319 [Caenispirillum bisanense]